MAAHIIADVDVKDAAGFEEYRTHVPPTIAQYGGKFGVRGGRFERGAGEALVRLAGVQGAEGPALQDRDDEISLVSRRRDRWVRARGRGRRVAGRPAGPAPR